MVCINNILPDEILYLLFFKFLDSETLFTTVRTVCKKWRTLAQNNTKLDFSQSTRYLKIKSAIKVFDFNFTVLKTLDLRNSIINNDDLNKISLGCPNLNILNINNCYFITNNGLECLSKNCSKLSRIDIRMDFESFLNIYIDNLGIYFLSKLSNLSYIDISNLKVNDDGFEHLSKCPLTELYASNCKISLRGVKALKNCKTLQFVTISIDYLTDEMNELFMDMDNIAHIQYV